MKSSRMPFLKLWCKSSLLTLGWLVCLSLASPALAAKKHTASPKKTTASAKLGSAVGVSAAVKQLAKRIADKHQLPLSWVQNQIANARWVPGVLKQIMPPATPQQKNWMAYRARFLTECRIQAGVRFWHTHADALTQAQRVFGVDPAYIVGILGVETFYGQNLGTYPVLDVLTTLSLRFPSQHPQAVERQAFFEDELGHYLRQQRTQPNTHKPKGSYAGAMGWPQFMPSSVARFAVDFDGDGRIDLINSPVDAIGSVANYFKAYGWQSGMPTHFDVDVSGVSDADLANLLAPDIVPSWSVEHLQQLQVKLFESALNFNHPLALVLLHNAGGAPTYVAGTDNFFTITRYNRSSYYALAVIELGEAIARAKELGTTSQGECP